MNIKWLITASAFALVSASAARAADIIVTHEPVTATTATPVIAAPAFSWTGFYLGGQIGNFSSKTKMDVLSNGSKVPVTEDFLPKLSGFMGGLYAGSNVDLGNGLVFGVDTDIIWANKDDTKTLRPSKIKAENLPHLNDVLRKAGIKINGERVQIAQDDMRTSGYTFKEKWAGATRMRIGFAANRILPYIAGGVAYTQLQDITSISVAQKDTGKVLASGVLTDETKSLVGYTLGAGVDFAMNNHIMVRAEYRYSDFGKKKFAQDKYDLSYKTNDFRVGVAYKF
ncbi:outer membrane protein [Bartonella sp. CB189]|uniref:outer membrane protein n=1 Tax=Bartonella sp. CB189 TaxID=3112254 RepID=UPI002F969AAE